MINSLDDFRALVRASIDLPRTVDGDAKWLRYRVCYTISASKLARTSSRFLWYELNIYLRSQGFDLRKPITG